MNTLGIYSSFSHRQRSKPESTSRTNSRDDLFLQKVERIISGQMSNPQFDVPMLAQQICLSVSQLNRRLNTLINCSAGCLIRIIRMRHAAQLLSKNAASVGDIAAEVGYPNQAHFCRSFKQQYGCAPSDYVRLHHSGK